MWSREPQQIKITYSEVKEMKRRSIKLLLGATAENELVFAEVSVGTHFSVCFDVVYPVEITEGYLSERAETYLDCMDKADLFDMCERYSCSPQDLLGSFLDDVEVEDLMDNSLYPEVFSNKDMTNEIYFESGSCGQCGQYLDDIRVIRHSVAVIDSIQSWWKLFHLQQVDSEKVNEFMDWLEELEADRVEETEWVEYWLKEVVNM